MWAYSFIQNALVAGIIVATVCALMSVFVILRRSGFAAHSLGHMSLTGAAGAALLGIPGFIGQLTINLLAGAIMGMIGNKIKKNDLAVGVVLSFVMGLGVYFLFLFQNNYAGSVMSILFGNIFAVSIVQLWQLLILAVIVLMVLLIIGRPLLFASLDPVIAAAKNVPLRILSVIFLLLLAVTVSMACQIVGIFLVFVLLIIPGAIGMQWCAGIYKIIIVSILTANIALIAAIYLAYIFDLPASFCITMLLCLAYLIGVIKHRLISTLHL